VITDTDIRVTQNEDNRHINIEIPGQHAVLAFFGEAKGSDGRINTFIKVLPGGN